MSATRSSLLDRVRDLDDREGWNEFDHIYRPMLVGYAQRRGLKQEAAGEIAQQCLAAIVPRIARFKRQKSFRGWLRKMVEHKVSDYHREQRKRADDGKDGAFEVPDRDPSPPQLWQQHWNRAHLYYVIRNLRSEFAEHTLRAFELYVLQELPIEQISQLLGMTPNQIYVAKHRVIEHLRERRFSELLDALYEESA